MGEQRRTAAKRRRRDRLEQTRRQEDGDAFGLSVRPNQQGQLVVRWRVDRDPMIGLMGWSELRGVMAGLERELVSAGRDAGYTWDDLAWAAGVTRQALQRRHPDVDRDHIDDAGLAADLEGL